MAAVSLFWNTKMDAGTPCENALVKWVKAISLGEGEGTDSIKFVCISYEQYCILKRLYCTN